MFHGFCSFLQTFFDIYAWFDKWVIKSVNLHLKLFPAGFQEHSCERNNLKGFHRHENQLLASDIINIPGYLTVVGLHFTK